MGSMLKDLLLHTLTILFPIIITEILLLDKFQARRTMQFQILTGLFGGASAMLCMTFPIPLDHKFILDFRWIPLLSTILYGGYAAGGLAVGMTFVYMVLLGGHGAPFSLLGSLLLAGVPFLFVPRFYKRSRRQRILISLSVSAAACLCVFAGMFIYFSYLVKSPVSLSFAYWFGLSLVLQLLLTLLAVGMIEKMIVISRMKTEMQQAERLSMISELAASLAHEVRNPLTVVRGFIQLAKSGMDGKGQQYMSTAIEELDRAEFIISDYLSFAKPQVERIDDMNVSSLVHTVATLMTSYATVRGIILDYHIEPDLRFRGDHAKLKQVLINLVKNGVEAMSYGGSMEIKAYKLNQYIWIQITDQGEGMTEEQLKQLGNTFYSTKEKGTGIGLMVAFQIVAAMNGKLLFKSAKGQGTTVTLRLPV